MQSQPLLPSSLTSVQLCKVQFVLMCVQRATIPISPTKYPMKAMPCYPFLSDLKYLFTEKLYLFSTLPPTLSPQVSDS